MFKYLFIYNYRSTNCRKIMIKYNIPLPYKNGELLITTLAEMF